MNKLALSYSKINSFVACPLQFKLQYLDKQPAPKTDPLLLGGAAHDFFEEYNRHLMKTQQQTDHAMAESIWRKSFHKFESVLRPNLYPDYEEICRIFTENHVLDLSTIEDVEVQIAVDKDFKPCEWMAEGVFLRAKIDRLDLVDIQGTENKKAVIVDYKTGWGGEADNFQLEIYGLLATIFYPEVAAIETRMVYVRSGFVEAKQFEKEHFLGVKEKILGYAKRIEKEKEFKPTPGFACTSCPFTSVCTAKPSNLMNPTSPEEAQQVAADILLIEASLKNKKRFLESWCVQNGPVTKNGVVFGHGTRETYKIDDPVAFVKALQEAGRDPTDFYKIDTTGLKKTCQKDPDLMDSISNAIHIETKTIWGHRKEPKNKEKTKNEHEPNQRATDSGSSKRSVGKRKVSRRKAGVGVGTKPRNTDTGATRPGYRRPW